MISDNYMDSTCEMLHELDYEAGFMEDLEGGEEIVIMEKNFENGETDVVSFYSVVPGSVRKHNYVGEHGQHEGTGIRFIVRTEKGVTKPMSYGGSWGIFIKRESYAP